MLLRAFGAKEALRVSPSRPSSFGRRVAGACAGLCSAVFLMSCSDPSGELFVDVRWQVKCPEGAPSCLPGQHLPHDIFTFAGGTSNEPNPEDRLPVTVSCLVMRDGEDDVLWDFTAETSEYRITVRDAVIPRTGGPVSGDNCTIEIIDAVNRYVGACGSEPISEEQPCRFTSVGFAYEDRVNGLFGPTLSTSLFCEGIRAPSTQILVRNVYAPNQPGQPVNGLVPINIVNCPGVPLD